MTPDSLAHRLRDIHELDQAGIWPLATGWWLVLGAVALLLLLAYALRRWRFHWRMHLPLPRQGWSRDATRELLSLRSELSREDAKTAAARLSELLRRIAIARCGRENCAGLQGEVWLAWLADHDPDGFDWQKRGQLLLDLPYAPPGELTPKSELQALIDAALSWTSQARSCPARQEAAHGV